ncbi:MAG: hypothetical protein EOS06_13130 [Mesorhizobium sp.]|nr:MAG: hypothetical protein EOS06_13130 [Mesorhizobium sp.]
MLICRDPSRPPLSCRTSPPLGGRLAALAYRSLPRRWRFAKAVVTAISPLVGEMSGRTEGAPRSAIKGSAPS